MFSFSALFSAAIVAASFDAAIERDAANGRVNSEFQSMLSLHYGLELPAAPAQALKLVNEFLTQAKAPKLAHGPGARAHAPAVGQALYALGEALHSAGKVKALPMLTTLPTWADPVAVAAAKAAAADKRSANKRSADKRSATAPAATAPAATAPAATAPAATAPAATAPAAAAAAPDVAGAVAVVLAAATGGFLSAAQIATLRAAFDTAPAAAATVPTKHKGGKTTVTAPAATATAPAATATAPAATAPRKSRNRKSQNSRLVMASMARDAAMLAAATAPAATV